MKVLLGEYLGLLSGDLFGLLELDFLIYRN